MTEPEVLGDSGHIETAGGHLDVRVHASQFPERMAEALREALRSRSIHPKFHYQSARQARHWIALHEAYSPSRTGLEGQSVYERAFASLAGDLPPSALCHVIGLGCGGAHKEALLAESLARHGHSVWFTPVDTSLPLVLTAWHRLRPLIQIPAAIAQPAAGPAGVVCDLESAPDLADLLLETSPEGAIRIITFFGMLPTIDPGQAMPSVRRLVGPSDRLLMSANLLPGSDPVLGIQRVLAQYQNTMTEDWLGLFLAGLGVGERDGELLWRTERAATAPHPVCLLARFRFKVPCRIEAEGESFGFQIGDEIRLFHSYRHTPDQVRLLLSAHSLGVGQYWVDPSGQEGVFACDAVQTGS